MKSIATGTVLTILACCLCARAVDAAEVVLGQIASTSSLSTGGLATSLNLGYRAYFEKINRQGGINGNTVRVVLRDDNLKVESMLGITREFIADKSIIGLVGYLNTPGMTEIAKQSLLSEAGIALVSPVEGDKRIVSTPNFFPFRSGYLDEVTALIQEIKQTRKERVFLLYQSTTFGPLIAAHAEEEAKRVGLNLVGKAIYHDTLDRFAASAGAAVERVVKANADAVLLIASGGPAFSVASLLRDAQAEPHIVYGLSMLQLSDIPPEVPRSHVHGVIIAQSVPSPYSGLIPLVREYQKAMKAFVPGQRFDYYSLEGFIGAKIVHEALKRAGRKPTRQSFLAALNTLGELDLGGATVNYSDGGRFGWQNVDLTIIDRSGRLQQ